MVREWGGHPGSGCGPGREWLKWNGGEGYWRSDRTGAKSLVLKCAERHCRKCGDIYFLIVAVTWA